MAVTASPSVVSSNLVFAYDMSNTAKSWKGKPTTNVLNTTSHDMSVYTGYTQLNTNVVQDPLSLSNVAMETSVQTTGINGASRVWIGSSSGVPTSGDYFVSVYVRKTAGGSSLVPHVYSGYSWYALNPLDGGSSYITETYRRFGAYISLGTASGGPLPAFSFTQNNSFTTGDVIRWMGPQLEASTFATPYIVGTRSSSQSLLDQTNTSTIDTTNVTYNANGTFSFNGSAQYATVPSSTLFNPGAGSYTIQLWCNIASASSSGWHLLIARRNQGGTGGYYIGINDTNGCNFMVTNNTGSRTDTQTILPLPFSYNTWFMLTAVLNRDTLTQTLIKDNFEVSSTQTPSEGIYENTSAFNIGGDPGSGSYYTVGQIPAVRVYNRALSTSEITQNFNATRARYGR